MGLESLSELKSSSITNFIVVQAIEAKQAVRVKLIALEVKAYRSLTRAVLFLSPSPSPTAPASPI
jgi:hypothetical protein